MDRSRPGCRRTRTGPLPPASTDGRRSVQLHVTSCMSGASASDGGDYSLRGSPLGVDDGDSRAKTGPVAGMMIVRGDGAVAPTRCLRKFSGRNDRALTLRSGRSDRDDLEQVQQAREVVRVSRVQEVWPRAPSRQSPDPPRVGRAPCGPRRRPRRRLCVAPDGRGRTQTDCADSRGGSGAAVFRR